MIDIGCSTGEYLLRAIEQSGGHATGIAPDTAALAQCRRHAAGRVSLDRLDPRQQPVEAFEWPPHPFDAALSIGSTHAFGTFTDTLRALTPRITPGGLILIADIFWSHPPTAAYREVIGRVGFPTPQTTFATNAQRGQDESLTLLYTTTSTQDEGNHFEGSFATNRHRRTHAIEPSDARTTAIDQATRWHNAYLQWGRETMGFGFYVFLKMAIA